MGMNKQWQEFIANLNVPVEFLHRDEFSKHYEFKDTKLPAAFLKRGDAITMLITHSEINECSSVEDLMHLLIEKVEEIEL